MSSANDWSSAAGPFNSTGRDSAGNDAAFETSPVEGWLADHRPRMVVSDAFRQRVLQRATQARWEGLTQRQLQNGLAVAAVLVALLLAPIHGHSDRALGWPRQSLATWVTTGLLPRPLRSAAVASSPSPRWALHGVSVESAPTETNPFETRSTVSAGVSSVGVTPAAETLVAASPPSSTATIMVSATGSAAATEPKLTAPADPNPGATGPAAHEPLASSESIAAGKGTALPIVTSERPTTRKRTAASARTVAVTNGTRAATADRAAVSPTMADRAAADRAAAPERATPADRPAAALATTRLVSQAPSPASDSYEWHLVESLVRDRAALWRHPAEAALSIGPAPSL